jgi:putative ABC transport system substrate-binding protein
MRRREFIVALAGAIVWPLAAHAQQQGRVYRLAALLPATEVMRSFWGTTVPELARLGYVAGRNLAVDARLALPQEMPATAVALAALKPDAIFAVGGEAIAASIGAAGAIPVVMYGADALLRDASLPLSRPQGNATGFAILGPELDLKRLEILHEAVPAARRIGVLTHPGTVGLEERKQDLARAAAGWGVELVFFAASGETGYVGAFEAIGAAGMEALLIASHPQFNTEAGDLAARATARKLPSMCHWREMAERGCLFSYGPSRLALFRRSAEYLSRILGGATPADLPIERPSQFEFVYNLRTAKALGLPIPPTLLARADEVIE